MTMYIRQSTLVGLLAQILYLTFAEAANDLSVIHLAIPIGPHLFDLACCMERIKQNLRNRLTSLGINYICFVIHHSNCVGLHKCIEWTT